MKKKYFYGLCLMLVMGLTFFACSSEESDSVNNETTVVTDESGMHYYKLTLNCDVPSYDDEGITRSAIYIWDNATNLVVRFKNGSKYYDGIATYTSSDNTWTFQTNGTLPVITGEGTCEVYYFYGDLRFSGTNVTLSEKSACYYTKTATYTHPTETVLAVNAFLDSKTWRLRFKGSSGTRISLPGENNDIKYFSYFNGQTGTFTESQKDVELTVGSDGYTPYIYGTYVNSSSNIITVDISDPDYYYQRNLASSQLTIGESGFLTLPTKSSYSGWTKKEKTIDPNAIIQVENMVTFTDGVVMTWKLGTTANTFDYAVFTKSSAEELTDDQLASEIYTSNPYTLEDADYLFKSTNSEWYTANTEYYLCAVAKNSSGKRGPVLRQLFKTNPDNLPSAEISNIRATSTTRWDWDVALKNNAKSYYMGVWTGEGYFNKDWHFTAYYVYRDDISGGSTTYDWTSVYLDLSQDQETCDYITICTWGVDANNNIGNPNVAFGSASSSSRSLSPANPSPQKDKMSPNQMSEMRKNMMIYRYNK